MKARANRTCPSSTFLGTLNRPLCRALCRLGRISIKYATKCSTKSSKSVVLGQAASKCHCTGFTLIELVISAALMSLILASAYACLRSGFASQKLIESRADVFQSARVAMALLSADLHGACPLSKNFDFLGMHRTLEDVTADNLDFATHNYTPRRPRESDWCEVSYFLEKDRKSQQFSLWRRRDATPDDQPLSGGKREEIARGLRGVKFEYYDGFEWYDEWGDPDGRHNDQNSWTDAANFYGMPEAVRITLWFDPALRSAAKKTTNTVEPPLVFQTVARLELADALQHLSSKSSSTNNVSASQAGPPAAPTGGRQ